MPIGAYIHVPFCRTRCHFCAFYLRVFREADAARYVDAVVREIDRHAVEGTVAGRAFDTVYFGGGTPTVLSEVQLSTILTLLSRRLGVQSDAEITVEAHPDDLDASRLAALMKSGVTRLSIGAQSFDEHELLRIGRPTLPVAVTAAVDGARRAGIRSVNLDLMYGLPGQSLMQWQDTLDAAIGLAPDHLSCYAYTVEPETRTAIDIARGDVPRPSDSLQLEMETRSEEILTKAGYERYEISNYARPGHRCRHNMLYWTGADYLGFGPSAQSYVGGDRFGVVANLETYCRTLESGALPIVDRQPLNPSDQLIDRIVFGLRRIEGIESRLVADAGRTTEVAHLIDDGWLEERDARLRLTEAGRRHADSVAERLF